MPSESSTGYISLNNQSITYTSYVSDCIGFKYLHGNGTSSTVNVVFPNSLIVNAPTIPSGATNITYTISFKGYYWGVSSSIDCTTTYDSTETVYVIVTNNGTRIASGSGVWSSSETTITSSSFSVSSLTDNIAVSVYGTLSSKFAVFSLTSISVTATYTPARVTSFQYKKSTEENYTSIGDSITLTSPATLNFKFTDNYGSSSHVLRVQRKLSSESTWSDLNSSTGTTCTANSTFDTSDSGNTYDYRMGYGTVSSLSVDKSFTVKLNAASETYKWKKHSDVSYTDVTTGSSVDANVGTNTGVAVDLKYTSTYGSSSYQLGIVIDGTIPSGYTSSDTTIEKTNHVFTTNGSHIISYVYSTDNWSTQVIACTFTIVVRGIVTGTPRFYVGGELVYNTTKVLARYNSTDITITGLSGLDVGTITYAWTVGGASVTSADYSFTPSSSGPSGSITLNNVSRNYTVTCVVSSYGTAVQTVTFGTGSLSCRGMTVALIDSFTPSEGDTSTEFTATGYSYIPLQGGTRTNIDGDWYLTDDVGNILTEGVEYEELTAPVIQGKTSFKFKMNINGAFTLYLTTDETQSSGLDRGIDSHQFNIANVVQMYFPTTSRYCVVLSNDTYECVLTRRDTNRLFDQLQFSSGLNKVGSASFNVIGANNLKCTVLNTEYDASSLVSNGTKVTILDNLCPVWSGVITGVNAVNVNFYNSIVDTSILNVTCEESLKELSYIYTTSDTYNGTISSIIEDLLSVDNVYDYVGSIQQSSISYSMSFDVSSILSAMDSISNQIGWRYRCRPNVLKYGDSLTINSGVLTMSTAGNVNVGDYIVIYDGSLIGTSGHEYDYNDGVYYTGKVASVSGTTITLTSYDKLPSNGTYKYTVHKSFLVDFKPAYYQDYVPLTVTINDTAQNVNEQSISADKFGEISVYGVGNSGETITSTMKAWMTINKDYTIPYSARISTSYDSTIDTVSMSKQYVLGDYTWSEFSVVLNGWSFPNDNSFSFSRYKPTIFYLSSDTTYQNGVRKMYLQTKNGDVSPTYISRYTDQTGMKKTSVTCAYRVSMSDGTTIPSTDTHYNDAYDRDGRLYADVLSSLSALTNVIFNMVKVSAIGYPLNSILPTNGYIRIGDTQVTCTSVNDSTGVLEFTWNTGTVPHGHMTDILVIDDSGTKYTPIGHKYTNETPDSPYAKYPNVKKTVQGAEGYSAMELERLACRYMQYGSNYDARGSADIVYNTFVKSDYVVGCKKILAVGDRIQFAKAESVSGGVTTYSLGNFELVSFTVNLSKNTVSVSFGMPFVEIGDVLYNMLSNSGMSIIPASNNSS